jgi:membrane-bound lytic murein transglycosylase D
MPDELAYVAMIESCFSSSAFSHASAVGYWQFIRETGKRYNLRIDPFVDERRDPILSTQSAANYLDSLYSLFGDWHLALASYNAGERRILNAVMKHRTRNFWELAGKRKRLPKETANYIPKYIAAVKIAKDPAKYGFTDIDFQPAFSFDSVVIDKPISLEDLAKELNVDFDEMKRMNPRYKSDYVPVYSDRINAVRVPVGMKEMAVAALPKCFSEAPKRFVASFEYYKVRRGDTLSHIARRYRTSIAKIRDLNDFSSRTLLRVGQKIKVPDATGGVGFVPEKKSSKTESARRSSSTAVASNKKKLKSQKKSQVAKTADKTVHVVRPGENLSIIARKYSVTVAQIAKANSLANRSKLYVGASLLIPD